ncbi:hypothetical protein [Acinetobacter seifertii]|uniref:hypothetical protein n=1 Tax=Acinetobacter seifertii TaxID=1530123 RepID=UPI0027DAE0B0|nr:hypothetical protein [Acinetobacter seifertii]
MKFKVEVSNIYVKEHIVEADDLAHALEIASEISDTMEANQQTFLKAHGKLNQFLTMKKLHTNLNRNI